MRSPSIRYHKNHIAHYSGSVDCRTHRGVVYLHLLRYFSMRLGDGGLSVLFYKVLIYSEAT